MKIFTRLARVFWITFLGLSLVACAGSLEDQLIEEANQADAADASDASDVSDASDPSEASDASDPGGEADASTADEVESKITNFPQDDDVILTLANATDNEEWVYFDFETQSQVYPSNAIDSDDWDIAFRRYRVKLNGGYYGTGKVIASAIDDVTLSEVAEAPSDNWKSDGVDLEDDEDFLPEEVLSSWFNYDVSTHILTPKVRVYTVRSVEGAFFKLEFAGYYDQNGDSGNPSIRWATVAAPSAGVVEPEIEEVGDVPVDPEDPSDDSDVSDPSDVGDSKIVNLPHSRDRLENMIKKL